MSGEGTLFPPPTIFFPGLHNVIGAFTHTPPHKFTNKGTKHVPASVLI